VGPDVPIVIVLNDEELVERLPAEPHDRPVTGALLPGAGLVTLGNNRRP
jgi:5-formyltetrahydrofolate cyclo-ligase